MIYLLGRASHIIAVSGATAAQLAAVAPAAEAKTTVAWNGMTGWAESMPERLERAPGPVRLLSLCRLAPRKNIPAAVDAAGACVDRGLHDFIYRIGGRGADADAVAERIAAKGLGERVQMLGFVPDDEARRLFGEADIFVHPQVALDGGRDVEGFGITIADAMASGAVCIVGQDGGPRELIEDGVNGIIVDGHDAAALTDAMARLIGDPAACHGMGKAAQTFAKAHFSWRRHARTVLALVGVPVSKPDR
jgi:glycosyltransferase involved in cell wall biosynthesis